MKIWKETFVGLFVGLFVGHKLDKFMEDFLIFIQFIYNARRSKLKWRNEIQLYKLTVQIKIIFKILQLRISKKYKSYIFVLHKVQDMFTGAVC